MQRYGYYALLISGVLFSPALGETSGDIGYYFDGVLTPQLEPADVQLASCCESACGDCCDTCVPDCCGSCCSSSHGCCLPNCGLLGLGVLTYDECGEGCPLPELLLGCFCKSCECFDDFVSPMTNPVHFEDPRTLTETRVIFLNHRVPDAAFGGDIQLYALQIRARLTERLSLIATKDGYVVSGNPLIDDGWADVDLGLKYALYRDPHNQTLLSAGAVYNMPVGTPRTRMARGDGVFHLFLTGGAQLCDCAHWLSGFGGIIPVDDDANSSFIYWSNHLDYQVRRGWYAVLESNWYHWVADGDDRLGLTGVDGGDLFNLGSGGVDGNDIVTGALGLKHKPNRKTEIGVAYEVPLTDRRDVTESRFTADLIFRY